MEVSSAEAAGVARRADPFDGLNAAQHEAVAHDPGPRSPPLLIIAGAGTGKTKTLAARVARLVLAGVDPQRILLLTFSRRAALEMSRRVGAVLHVALGLRGSAPPPALAWAGTFHSVGARLLRDHAAQIGLDPSFTVQDRGDSEDLIDLVRHRLGLSATQARFPQKGTCLGIYSRVVNTLRPLDDVLRNDYPWCAMWEAELKSLFAAYVELKQQQRVLDFDDLLLCWAAMAEHPGLAAAIGARFDHILVDEYQDTNRLQATILQRIRPLGHGVVAVGDDAQAIYSFRGAEVRNILDFAGHFKTPARCVTLEQNYRSTQAILDASNAVMGQSGERFAKRLWTQRVSSHKPLLVTVEDEAAQGRWVADRVLADRENGMALKQQAVLFRTSHHSAALELELVRRNIPFHKFGGLKFLEALHIKDVLSVLRWADNPRCELAGFRVAKLIAGVGPASARRMVDAVSASESPAETLLAFKAPAGAEAELSAFAALYAKLRHGGLRWPADLDLATAWYLPHLQRRHDDAAVRSADLTQLAHMAKGYGSRERFLTELALDPPDATSDESGPPHLDEDYLILSTIHSSKGQEWRSVSVLNVVDGCMPSDLSVTSGPQIEEERRLLYVAMTRAKEHLQLIVPQRFYVHQQAAFGDRHVYGALTRFIPPTIHSHFERVGPQAPVPVASAPLPLLTFDIATRLRASWR